jgi:hypothetical protein
MKILLKYFVTAVLPQLVVLFGGKYLGTEAAAGLGLAVAAGGARALHLTEAPTKGP